jgi:hypothetical protein
MANPGLSEIATTTIANRTRKVQDNVTKNNAILMRLKQKGKIRLFDGGDGINEELSYSENGNATWYSGADVLGVGAQDVLTSAVYTMKLLACAVVITGEDELKNSGEARIIDLLGQRIVNAEGTMANKVAQGLYSDGTTYGGKTLTGLDAAVPQDPTTGTYGGINRATTGNEFWRSQLYDPASTPTSSTIQGYMNALWALCVRGKDHPDLIMAGATNWATFTASLQLLQRFSSPEVGDLGFPALKFMGADVVLDGGIGGYSDPEDMYFLNTNYLHFRPHKDRNMVPIGKKRESLNQDVTVQILGFAGNLTCSGAQFQGRLKGD